MGCTPQPSQYTEPRSRSKVTSHSIHCGTVKKVPESCREVRDPPLGEQLLDPGCWPTSWETLWCLGQVGTEQLGPGGHGGAGTGHLGSWERNSEVGKGAGHLRVATVTASKPQGRGKCPESWPVQLPQHRNKGSGVLQMGVHQDCPPHQSEKIPSHNAQPEGCGGKGGKRVLLPRQGRP